MGENLTIDTIEDILEAQFEALRRGDDPTRVLVATWPALGGLLHLARQLYETLVGVKPDPGFVSALQRELVGSAGSAHGPAWTRFVPRSNAARAASALGLALGAGISFLALRPLLSRLLMRAAPGAVEPLPAPAEG